MRSGRRWLLAFPLALALGLPVLPLAKASVDDALVAQARAALAARGVRDVTVTGDWAALTLTGPAGARAAALRALDAMPDRSAVARVRYVAPAPVAAPAPAPTPTPTPTPAPVVATSVGLSVARAGGDRVVVLEGRVAGAAQRDAVAAAVRVWVPAVRVDDRLEVVAGVPSESVRSAWPAFLRIVGPAAANLTSGGVRLAEEGVGLEGTTGTEAGAARLNAAARAAASEVEVTGSVRGPVAVARARLAAIRGLGSISFERGSERLTAGSRRALDAAAAVLRGSPDVLVEVRGHTDTKGPDDLNERLSRRRAAQVVDYLVDRGVPARRLRAVGVGEKDPLRSNKTTEGRAANRRIELVVKEA